MLIPSDPASVSLGRLWPPGCIWLHAVSDAVIGRTCLGIPPVLLWPVRRRPDLEFRSAFYLFVAFVLFCGATHFMSILALWVPAYAAEGLVKAVTALLAIGTAILVWPLAPRLFALPSAVQLGRLNAELAGKVEEQERTSHLLRQSAERVRLANAELERRVEERTADLRAANERLKIGSTSCRERVCQ